MVIVFGRRSYGRVEQHGGEYAQSTFAHVYYMPIIPVSSFWVTQDLGDTARGFSINMSGKSIAAAYLRCWGPIAVIASLASGAIGGYIAAALFAAASAWAWSWRSLRGPHALRKSDFQMLAFGTRCDPERMPAEMREQIKHSLDERWAALDGKRSPDEVAELGAASPREAVLAYGLLRLASIDAPAPARGQAAAAAHRILTGAHDVAQVMDGPYRAADQDVAAAPIFSDVAHAATHASAASQAAAAQLPRTDGRKSRVSGKRIAALLVAMFALGGLYGFAVNASAFAGAQQLSPGELRTSRSGFVAVRCDAMESVGVVGASTSLYACATGTTVLPVVGFKGFATPGTVVEGKLHSMRDGEYIWPDDVRDAPELTGTYLEFSPVRSARHLAIEMLVMAVLLIGGGAWFVVRRRRSQRH